MYLSVTLNISLRLPRAIITPGHSLGHSTSHRSILETATTVSTLSTHSRPLLQVPSRRSRYSSAYSHHRKNASCKLSLLPAHLDSVSTWTQAALSKYLEHYSDTPYHFSSRRHGSCIKPIGYTTKSDLLSILVQSLVVKQPKTLGMHLRMMWRDWDYRSLGNRQDGARGPQGGSSKPSVDPEPLRLVSACILNSWISGRTSFCRLRSHRASAQCA
jgi:hypothetical protein